MAKHPHETHGHVVGGKMSRTYVSWNMMMARCYRESSPSYQHYGAKGIKVCARWHTFENFLADMGERPEGMTLDRKDLSKGYHPKNCRWADRKTQAREKGTYLAFGGKTQNITDWAVEMGLKKSTLSRRLRKGETPPHCFRPVGASHD